MMAASTRSGSQQERAEEQELGRELDLFQQVAAATGDTLEAVWRMREEERADLIAVLGLASTQVASVRTQI
jgi:hypothetical protein